jgi:hypothetical protein
VERARVLVLAEELRQTRQEPDVPRDHQEAGKCQRCGFTITCGQALQAGASSSPFLLSLDRIENGLGGNVLLDLLDLRTTNRLNVEVRGERLHHPDQPGQFVLGQQVDLQVERRLFFRCSRHTVLADQDECREKIASTEAIMARMTKESAVPRCCGHVPH